MIEAAAIVASNTSTLPSTSLAPASHRPQHFIGLHFFSPVEKMPLVEISVGKHAGDGTRARAFDFVPFHGGALQFINAMGAAAFVARSRELAAKFGPRFAPADVRVQQAARGEAFVDR